MGHGERCEGEAVRGASVWRRRRAGGAEQEAPSRRCEQEVRGHHSGLGSRIGPPQATPRRAPRGAYRGTEGRGVAVGGHVSWHVAQGRAT